MVWISSLKSNYALGDDLGVRSKFFGHEWEPATPICPDMPDDVFANMRLYGQGHARKREELPEAAAVWDEKRFKKVGNIFTMGFFVVRKSLADVLARFDLGDGGLFPFNMYRADLATPYPGEFFLLNFGAIKNTILPGLSQNITKGVVRQATGQQLWKINGRIEDEDIALSSEALVGSDLWFEDVVYNKIFISDRLAEALIDMDLKEVFDIKRCRVIEGAA